jgi:hypothetical protein
MSTFNYQSKIRSLIRNYLNLEPNCTFTLQVLKFDESPPYITNDRIELTHNDNQSNKIFVVVGEGWLTTKLYNEVDKAVIEILKSSIKIEYL